MNQRDPRTIAEIRSLLEGATGRKLKQLSVELAHDDRVGVAAALAAAHGRETAAQKERARLSRLYSLEDQLRAQGFLLIAGVDEVGRGALAGPLTAGACILPARPHIQGVDDSKQLSPAKRRSLAAEIREVALCWAVGHVAPDELDSLGVTAALRRAMGRALAGLELEPDHVVVDGHPVGVTLSETAVIKGDSKVAAISAASIIAKVARDEIMVAYSEAHPGYGFEINKGYGTPEHLDSIARVGLSPIHRRSFCPGGGTQSLF